MVFPQTKKPSIFYNNYNKSCYPAIALKVVQYKKVKWKHSRYAEDVPNSCSYNIIFVLAFLLKRKTLYANA